MFTIVRDLQLALRMLRRSPLHTAVALATLALGIGSNTAVFSVLYGTWLASLPYGQPSGLLEAQIEGKRLAGGNSWPNVSDWKSESRLITDFGVYRVTDAVNITGAGEPEEIIATRVSANLLSVLEVAPILGHPFAASADRAGGTREILLSYDYWRTRLGGRPDAAGMTVGINGDQFTIAGVMPRSFVFPPGARAWKPVAWLSLNLSPDDLSDRERHSFFPIGRMKPGVPVASARAELETIQSRLAAAWPKENGGLGVRVNLLADGQGLRDARPALALLMSAVALVLLIACVNVANLQLARSATRRREFAVRLALGVARGRLAAHLVVESVLTGLLGGALGVAVAWWTVRAIQLLLPPNLPRVAGIGLNPPVLAFSLAVSLLSGVIFGLVPAVQAGRVPVDDELKCSGRTAAQRSGLSRALVAVEVAFAVLLLSAGGLLVETYRRVAAVDPGFSPGHVLTARIPLPRKTYNTGRRVEAFHENLLQRVRAIPGVQYAGMVSDLPMGILFQATDFEPEGSSITPAPLEGFAKVSAGYFEAMGISLLGGRYFNESDRAETPAVAVISESLARRYWPAGNALGSRVRLSGTQRPDWFTIAGIVRDVREFGPERETGRYAYVLSRQVAEPVQATATSRLSVLVVRATGDPAPLIGPVRAAVGALDRDQPIADLWTMQQVVDRTTSGRRLNAVLLGAFGGLALVLAGIGVFGVVAFTVAARTREIGIRVALGASPAAVVRAMARDSLQMAIGGAALGAAATALCGKVLGRFLFGVRPTDPATLLTVSCLLLVVLLAGAILPARRALAVDPAVALRQE